MYTHSVRAESVKADALVRFMIPTTSHEITALLRCWSEGQPAALDTLVPIVDRELHRIAKYCLKGQAPDPILDSTALINEAYIRLIDHKSCTWHDRAHFFAVCSKTMRRILVDHARAHRSAKRGGGTPRVSLSQIPPELRQRSWDVLAIDECLRALARLDSRKERVVELRFFGGLSIEETADALRVSSETVRRDWRIAKAWLFRELSG